jgi:hypothetical protein
MSTPEHQRDRAARAAKNQALFREINEGIKVLNAVSVAPIREWICECADKTCIQRVELTLDEYEAVRAQGTRFFVFPSDDHVWPDVERIVERNTAYWIVGKIGAAGEAAMLADPRSDDRPPHLDDGRRLRRAWRASDLASRPSERRRMVREGPWVVALDDGGPIHRLIEVGGDAALEIGAILPDTVDGPHWRIVHVNDALSLAHAVPAEDGS